MKIEFKCPECGCGKIEEIQIGVTVSTEISEVSQDDDAIEGGSSRILYTSGEQTNEDGHVDRYQCGGCGFTIVDHMSPHSDDGLDEAALVNAIQALSPPKKGDEVDFEELVRRIADQYRTLSGEELAGEWNKLFPEQVVYGGDSMFWVKE